MRKIILLVIAFFMVLPTMAQFSNTEDVEMTPFFADAIDLQGLRPTAWLTPQNTLGFFQRGPNDPTAILMQSLEADPDEFVADLPTQLQLSEPLTEMDAIETDAFTWDVYQSARSINETWEVVVDVAVTFNEDNGRTYFVVLQTNPVFYDNLHENVFLVAVNSISPINIYTDADETFTVPVPPLWDAISVEDGFGQLTNEDESIVVFVDSVEGDDAIAASEAFLSQVNPDFDLTYDEEVHQIAVIEDVERIGELDSVTLIYWEDGDNDEEFILQTVARQYDGVVYLTAIVSNLTAISENGDVLAIIDNGLEILALEDLTEDAETSDEETSSDD